MLMKSSKHHSYKKTFSESELSAESFIPKSHFMRRRRHGIPDVNGPPNNSQTETFSTIQKKWTPRFSCWLSVLSLSTLCVVFLSNPGNNFGNLKVPKWTLLIGNGHHNLLSLPYFPLLVENMPLSWSKSYISREISISQCHIHAALVFPPSYLLVLNLSEVNNFLAKIQQPAYPG